MNPARHSENARSTTDARIHRLFAPDGQPRIDRRILAAEAEEPDGTIRELFRHRSPFLLSPAGRGRSRLGGARMRDGPLTVAARSFRQGRGSPRRK